jgi:hypothetical protein
MLIKTETTITKRSIKTTRKDFKEIVSKFKFFAHFSQFDNIPRDITKMPKHKSVRIDNSYNMAIGETLFGIDENENLTWLGETVDCGD